MFERLQLRLQPLVPLGGTPTRLVVIQIIAAAAAAFGATGRSESACVVRRLQSMNKSLGLMSEALVHVVYVCRITDSAATTAEESSDAEEGDGAWRWDHSEVEVVH